MKCGIVPDHHLEFQLFRSLLIERGTNQSPAMRSHKIDDLGRDTFCSADKITFIFPVFIIYDNHYPAFPDILNSVADAIQANFHFDQICFHTSSIYFIVDQHSFKFGHLVLPLIMIYYKGFSCLSQLIPVIMVKR